MEKLLLEKMKNSDIQDSHWITYQTLQSHFMQIYLTLALKVKDVLEIGVLRKIVTSILDTYCNLTTLDYKEEFHPDLLIDITDFKQLDTIENNAYDLILLCEVLEHVPYEKIEGILQILKEKTRKYLIISVPNQTTYINLALFSPCHRAGIKLLKNYFNFFFVKLGNAISDLDYKLRKKYKKHKPIGTFFPHFWELGVDKYSLKSFKKLLEKHFIILREERFHEHSFHHYFILKKRID